MFQILLGLLGFSPDLVAPGWRSEAHQFELATDNSGCCDVLNGHAVSPLALRPVFASATAHIEELLDYSWGVGTSGLSWCRWLPRAYNTVADRLCRIATTNKTSFREELWEEEDRVKGNLQARTDGGWHSTHGGVAAWALWRFSLRQNIVLPRMKNMLFLHALLVTGFIPLGAIRMPGFPQRDLRS